MNLEFMVVIDKQVLETPFYGVQHMTWHLQNEGHVVKHKRIRRLMRLMRLMPIYQKPDTRCPATHACMCEREQAREGPQDLTVSLGRFAAGAAQLGLVHRHHLPAQASWRPLSRCHHGLAHPKGSGLAYPEHAESRLFRQSAERGHPQVRLARGHENRSGHTVHILRLDPPAETGRHPDLDGRQGTLP